MHRIDGPGATSGNLFTEGNPFAVPAAIDATVVTADWLNDVQEEIVGIILAAGSPLQKGNQSQLFGAITVLIPAVTDPRYGRNIPFTAPQAFSAGDPWLLGDSFVVVQNSPSLGQTATGALQGSFDLAKKSADVFAEGDKVYWDNGNEEVTTTAGGNRLIGVAREAKGNGDTTMEVRIPAPSSAN